MVWRGCVRPTLVIGGAAVGVLALAGLVQSMVALGVRPSPALFARLFAGAALASLAVALPAAALGGLAAGLRQLRDDGAWRGLATLGVPGRALLLPLAGWLVLLGLAYGAVAHAGEPWGRRIVRDARAEAASRVVPREGRTVRVGAWSVAVDGDRLRLAGEGWFGSAGGWTLTPARGAVVAELTDLVVEGPDGARVRAERAVVPVPLGLSGRLGVGERDSAELWARARDPYERWVLWKRSLLPAALVPLGLALVPAALAGRWPPLALTAAALVPWWVAVRLLDGQVTALGVGVAAGVVLAGAVGAAVAAWARWGER